MQNLMDILRGLRSVGAEAARQTLEPSFYSLGLHAYALGADVASLGMEKARLIRRGQADTWRKLRDEFDPSQRWIWVHAASLGEFEQGRPIMEEFRRRLPEYKILLTFFSPSGYEVRKNWPGADLICYLPLDTPSNARRFVERVRPEKAIFIKYEIWRNYLKNLWNHQIPAYLVSAAFRPDQVFFHKRGVWYREWLRWFSHIFVQDELSRKLLRDVGFDNVTVAGDTRFDRVNSIMHARKRIPQIEAFLADTEGTPPMVLMAGSSWPADEERYIPWVNAHRGRVKVVVAPHEFDQTRLKELCSRFTGDAVLLSEVTRNPEAARGKQALVIDCFGLLSSAYAYCDAAYIGGGFGAGIHNINEAAVYGVPVIFGPRHQRFVEAGELIACGGGTSVASRKEFGMEADILLNDTAERQRRGAAAGAYIQSHLGATGIITDAIS